MTNLNKGEIAIVQYNANDDQSTTPAQGSGFTFVLLRDIDAGTNIQFTTSGLDTTGKILSTGANWSWTSPNTTLAAGTTVRIYTTDTNNPWNQTTSGSVTVTNSGIFNGASAGLDQLFVYQGASVTNVNSTISNLLFGLGFNSDNNNNTLDPATGWNTINSTSQTQSRLPTVLANYQIAFLDPANDSDGYYTPGSHTGTATSLFQDITTRSKWTNTSSYLAQQSYGFSLSNPAPAAPTITGLTDASDSGTQGDNRTDASFLTIFGTTTAAGDTVNLYLDGSSTVSGTAVTDASNRWTYSLFGPSTTSHTLTATVTRNNVTGAVSTPYTFYVDPVPSAPSVTGLTAATDSGASSTDGITKNTTIGAQGTGTNGDTVNVYVDNATSTSVGNAIVNNGVWSIASLTGTLSPGSHTLKATQTDPYGNISAYSSSYAVTIDTTAPAAPSTPALDSASDSGSSNSDRITNDTTPTVTGTAESGSTVTLYDTDGTTPLGSAVATGGNYSITSSALSDATHTLTVKATDTAGNTSSASSGLSVDIDATAPTLSSASVNGNQLLLAYTEANSGIDGGAIPGTQNFTVEDYPASGSVATDQVTGVSFNSSNKTYTLTLQNPVGYGDFVTVSYGRSSGPYIQDYAGNLAAGFVPRFVTNNTPQPAPKIQSGGLRAPAGPVNAGRTFTFSITFDQAVTVDTAGNNTNLSLALNNSKTAAYSDITPDHKTVSFVYTVGANDDIADLQATGFNTPQNGATIKGSSSVNADLVTNFPSLDTGTRIDTVAPFVLNASAPSSPTNASSLVFNYGFSERVTGVVSGDFTLRDANNNPISGVTIGTPVSTDQGRTYNVTVSGLASINGVVHLDLNTGTFGIQDLASNSLAAAGFAGGNVTLDHVAPSVLSINRAAGSASLNNATSEIYTVTFSEGVTGVGVNSFSATSVTGTITNNVASVTPVNGSNGSAYTVTVNGVSGNGELRLDLKGSNTGIQDLAGNDISGGFTGGQVYTIDQTAPTIASATVPTNGGYRAGQNLDFTVTYGEAVSVTGTPRIPITLDTGGLAYASYLPGSGNTLTFRYTPTTGQQDPTGIVLASSIDLNGGTIKDAAGNDASLSITGAPTTAGILIDTQPPSVSSISLASGAAATNNATSEVYTVTFSEAVSGVDASDFTLTPTGNSTATGTLGAQSVVAVASSNGYATTYTVTATGVNGYGTLRLDLNASSTGITDKVGNPIAAGFITGQIYTIDQIGPSISGVTLDQASYKFGDTVTATIQLSGVYDGHGAYTLGAGSTLDGQTLTAGSYDSTNNRLTATFVANANVNQIINGTVLDNIQVSDAVGNISAASTAGVPGVTIDTIAPAIDTAKVNGNTLTLTYLEAGSGLYAGQNIAAPAAGDYAVTVGNVANIVTAVAVDATAKTVTLTLTNAVATSDVVGLAYTAGADAGALRDIAGNRAANLSLPSVTNVTPLPPSGGGGSSSTNMATPNADRLAGTLGDDTIAGLGGNDTISGDDGNDLLYGNQGNDSIIAGSGNNTVYGGIGDDILSSGSGNDLIFGNEGADTINAGDGNNTLVGGQDSNDGADLITSGSGNDLIYGNGGDDSIASGAGDDIVVGGFGNDILFGNQGNDLVYGNQGNDIIYGGQGDDTLIGGQGDDTLIGGEGNDVIYGNEGADRIVFGINSGNDRVMDFSQSDGDKLDLQGQTYTTTTDVNGNAVLTLSGGGMITLAGIAASQVNAGMIA